jgi:hypothetical protein
LQIADCRLTIDDWGLPIGLAIADWITECRLPIALSIVDWAGKSQRRCIAIGNAHLNRQSAIHISIGNRQSAIKSAIGNRQSNR